MGDGGGVAEEAGLVLRRARGGEGGLIVHRLAVMDEIDQQADGAAFIGEAEEFDFAAEDAFAREGQEEAAEGWIFPSIVCVAAFVEGAHFFEPWGGFVCGAGGDDGEAVMILDGAADLAAGVGA